MRNITETQRLLTSYHGIGIGSINHFLKNLCRIFLVICCYETVTRPMGLNHAFEWGRHPFSKIEQDSASVGQFHHGYPRTVNGNLAGLGNGNIIISHGCDGAVHSLNHFPNNGHSVTCGQVRFLKDPRSCFIDEV